MLTEVLYLAAAEQVQKVYAKEFPEQCSIPHVNAANTLDAVTLGRSDIVLHRIQIRSMLGDFTSTAGILSTSLVTWFFAWREILHLRKKTILKMMMQL